jgi:rod shape-determining protein MreD
MINYSKELKIWLLVFFSFLGAFGLTLLHIPSFLELIYPQWLLIALLYWIFVMPYRVNVGIAWVVGFLLDLLYNAPVGENALILVMVSYIIILYGNKIKLLGLLQKIALMFVLVFCCQLLPLMLQMCFGGHFCFWPILGKTAASVVVLFFMDICFAYKEKFYFEKYY